MKRLSRRLSGSLPHVHDNQMDTTGERRFSRHCSWIANESPAAASRIGRVLLAAVEGLEVFPFRGKPGRSRDTRELVISGLPYLVVYSVEPAAPVPGVHTVNILRVLHGAMLWPLVEDE